MNEMDMEALKREAMRSQMGVDELLAAVESNLHEAVVWDALERQKLERMTVVAGGCQPFERKAQWKREQGFGRGRRRVK